MFDVEPTKSLIGKDKVFSNDVTATSAITGIYASMYSNTANFASGSINSVASLAGLSADEFRCYADYNDLDVFNRFQIVSTNPFVLSLWTSMYNAIYSSNSALTGLGASTSLTTEVKQQLTGEAYFIRAFAHFYLVNLFGDVPIVTTIDSDANSDLTKRPVSEVYDQIVSDLMVSRSLLSDSYVSDGRVRPNRATADALLARVYLYLENWSKASEFSSAIISDPQYGVESIDLVFTSESDEAIWQLMPEGLTINTNEGNLLVLQTAPIYSNQPLALNPEIIQKFDAQDARLSNWVGQIEEEGVSYWYSFKYKIPFGGVATMPPVPLSEYGMVFRLAEQYLIRSEARLHLSERDGAIEDLNVLRGRAGLALLDSSDGLLTLDSLTIEVANERVRELFTEWGHRWLDVKRTGKADEVFSNRPNYLPDFKRYPIPQEELDRNPKLGKQNDGY
ncbi:RagB/SusD family nutrient uptake outer membrane protein [Parachryseolinea silvisoli]|uniref:RagB/SusD family nutrient uptake outer membrane protein n=1 Tax=Parachryseolinea silvisoli TaxID=2873601 RepID=UPI002265B7EE|nr:RagB/SusD family nutrient uptake outer membrane protein [Parachryseolinea silvisoli]MCD9015446.1 RagB/SusD family nutrient uptake outer membrane protein [Parachryseolinea silvisoli]